MKKVTMKELLEEFVEKKDYKPYDMSICGKCSKCGECCSNFLPVCQDEVDIIQKYVIEKNIVLKKNLLVMQNQLRCPYYDGKNCMIYEVRPLICKEFYCNKKPTAEIGAKFATRQYIPVNMWGIAEEIEKQRKEINNNEKYRRN